MNYIFIGRFTPFHKGHYNAILSSISNREVDIVHLLLGSCNHSLSMRHFFTMEQRIDIINTALRDMPFMYRIIPIPDYDTDSEWTTHLNIIIKQCDIDSPTFITGSYADSVVTREANYVHTEYNRFDKGDKISATEIRDCLFRGRDLPDYFVNKEHKKLVQEYFTTNFNKFKTM